MRKLHIKMRKTMADGGEHICLSDVEVIYGDPFSPRELGDEFWGSFEASLENIDAERLNLFFGKDRKGLREMRKSIRNAKRILREAFCAWISTIAIDRRDSDYQFGDHCFFINFNYTDTLHKRFGIGAGNECHIHGEAADKASILFGHSAHPWLPEDALARLGGRFGGLYLLENLLYETDKHVADNIQMLCMDLAIHGVVCEQIRRVYVLGHSMSTSDLAYFEFLSRATGISAAPSVENVIPEEYNDLEELHKRLQFIIESVGYHRKKEQIDPAYWAAIQRKYEREQAVRSAEMQKAFLKIFQKVKQQHPGKSLPAEAAAAERTEAATWYITYHKAGKERIEKTVQDLNLNNYQLYPNIEDCLSAFRRDTAAQDSTLL